MTAIILDDGSAALLAEVSALKAERNALLANIASQRMEIDGLKAEKDAALELANQSAARADKEQALVDVLHAAVTKLLASAHPHPVDHKAMTAAWAVGREALEAVAIARSQP